MQRRGICFWWEAYEKATSMGNFSILNRRSICRIEYQHARPRNNFVLRSNGSSFPVQLPSANTSESSTRKNPIYGPDPYCDTWFKPSHRQLDEKTHNPFVHACPTEILSLVMGSEEFALLTSAKNTAEGQSKVIEKVLPHKNVLDGEWLESSGRRALIHLQIRALDFNKCSVFSNNYDFHPNFFGQTNW